MRSFKRENVIIKESNDSKIKELKAQGFKEIGKDGKVIDDPKEVSKTEFNKIKKELESLKKENEALKQELESLKSPKEDDKK